MTLQLKGSVKAGEPFYFCIQGADLKIEFIQIDGNHIYMVIHDARLNFGGHRDEDSVGLC